MPEPKLGLFSGFEGYRSTTEESLVAAMQGWLVALDTNVLLSLYQFQGTTRADLIKVFEAFGDRLFVPHQVIDEFWRNRRTVLSENQGKHREAVKIEESFQEILTSFGKWFSRVVDRSGEPPAEVIKEVDEAADAVLQYIRTRNAEFAPTGPDTPTHDDHVLQMLAPLLEGHVGAPSQAEQLTALLAEGKRRVSERIPPGYLDAAKAGARPIGDFLVWQQTMEESKRRDLPVLLVTQDQKEDWWADRGTPSMRARPELVAELLAHSGHPLLMVRSHDLLRLAGTVGVDVSAATLRDAETAADYESTPWKADSVDAFIDVLAHGWPVHLKMLAEAMDAADGSISRERMAEMLDRDASARMTGITRPYHTAIKILRERGFFAEVDEVPVPLFAWYAEGGVMSHMVLEEACAEPFAARRDHLLSSLPESPEG